jgi:transposase
MCGIDIHICFMCKSVVLYGCETWSLTLREERRPRVFENGVLRRIFGSKRDGVTGACRKLHNELHDMMWENGLDWAG